MNALPEPATFDQADASICTEQALIGSCLAQPDTFAAVSALVDADHMSEQLHATVWTTLQQLAAAGKSLTPLNLVTVLGNGDVGGGVKLSVYLARCASEAAMPGTMAPDLARSVRHAWALRQISGCAAEADAAAKRPGADPGALMGDIMEQLEAVRSGLNPRSPRFISARELSVAFVDQVATRYAGAAAHGVTTGLCDLDQKLGGGLHKGDLVILAGRPGMGKTLTAVSMTRNAAQAGHACGVFSLEMAREQIGARYISNMLFERGISIASGPMLYGNLSEQQAEHVMDAARRFAELPLHVDDSSGLLVGEIYARSRALADRFSRQGKTLELIAIDYLKFVRASDRYRGQRHYEVGEISAALKALAKDLGVAVVLLAQLNRMVESREDKRPQLSDLRESGDLEADADQVIFLYREAYYLEQREPKPGTEEHLEWQTAMSDAHNNLEIIIAKNRMGATGGITAFCNPGLSVVKDMIPNERLPEFIDYNERR